MRRSSLAFLLLLLSAAGCRKPPPEGVYPCTIPADCFANWVCRESDHRCWMTPDPDAGTDAARGDAATPLDAFSAADTMAADAHTDVASAIDAFTPVDACAPADEVCDGHDNDCDG